MSDTQRDREERQHVIEVLKSWDGYFIGYTSDEVQEALRYAIASIETDLKYDLMYEKALEQEPKSEWEHDHEILKAYSDGQASIITVLEAIKAEIEQSRYGLINDGLDVALKIIDKHISEMGDMAEIEPQESEG